MSMHRIRLRRAWEVVGGGTIDLPTTLDPRDGSRRLRRAFRPPALDVAGESLSLELGRVNGLDGVILDGRRLADAAGPDGSLVVALPRDLPARCVLELIVDAAALPAGVPHDDWGHVALRIDGPDANP